MAYAYMYEELTIWMRSWTHFPLWALFILSVLLFLCFFFQLSLSLSIKCLMYLIIHVRTKKKWLSQSKNFHFVWPFSCAHSNLCAYRTQRSQPEIGLPSDVGSSDVIICPSLWRGCLSMTLTIRPKTFNDVGGPLNLYKVYLTPSYRMSITVASGGFVTFCWSNLISLLI